MVCSRGHQEPIRLNIAQRTSGRPIALQVVRHLRNVSHPRLPSRGGEACGCSRCNLWYYRRPGRCALQYQPECALVATSSRPLVVQGRSRRLGPMCLASKSNSCGGGERKLQRKFACRNECFVPLSPQLWVHPLALRGNCGLGFGSCLRVRFWPRLVLLLLAHPGHG